MVWYRRKVVWAIGVLIIILSVNGIYANINKNQKEERSLPFQKATKELSPSEGNGTNDTSVESKVETLTIHVCGEVKNPGVYTVKSKSRVCDAVDSAGGLTEKADPMSINLAEPLMDGQQVVIYEKQESGTDTTSTQVTSTSKATSTNDKQGEMKTPFPISLNRGNLEELMLLDGIGEKTAQKIIDYRKEQGGFKKLEELKNVPGIGEKKFEKIKGNIKL